MASRTGVPGFDYSFKPKNCTKSIVMTSLGITKAQYAILENKAHTSLETTDLLQRHLTTADAQKQMKLIANRLITENPEIFANIPEDWCQDYIGPGIVKLAHVKSKALKVESPNPDAQRSTYVPSPSRTLTSMFNQASSVVQSTIPLNKIVFQVYHKHLGSINSREYSAASLCQDHSDDEIEDEEALKPQSLKLTRLLSLLDEDGVRLDKREILWSLRTDSGLDPLEKDRHFRDVVRRYREAGAKKIEFWVATKEDAQKQLNPERLNTNPRNPSIDPPTLLEIPSKDEVKPVEQIRSKEETDWTSQHIPERPRSQTGKDKSVEIISEKPRSSTGREKDVEIISERARRQTGSDKSKVPPGLGLYYNRALQDHENTASSDRSSEVGSSQGNPFVVQDEDIKISEEGTSAEVESIMSEIGTADTRLNTPCSVKEPKTHHCSDLNATANPFDRLCSLSIIPFEDHRNGRKLATVGSASATASRLLAPDQPQGQGGGAEVEEQEWEVIKILDKRETSSGTEYKVCWKSTWLPRSELGSARRLLREYEAKSRAQHGPKRGRPARKDKVW